MRQPRKDGGFDDRIFHEPELGLTIDLADAPRIDHVELGAAFEGMKAIEAGALANRSEGRMVGHYWLRAPERAPRAEIRGEIEAALARIDALDPGGYRHLLLLGIGGSALGFQLIDDALAAPRDAPRTAFLDNTDPDTFAAVLDGLDPAATLAVVTTKSGTTQETRNALDTVRARWERAGVDFAANAIAITSPGSALDLEAAGWRDRFPIWDWVGGRTSLTSAAGLVPMKLTRRDTGAFLDGARACDEATRREAVAENPAALLAATWFAAGCGDGSRSLVVEPYRDRLRLLPAYLQQLVMESLGKREDRSGREVRQGLTVFGNRGTNDQHSFVQQLRDGRDDAFVHFVETLAPGPSLPAPGGGEVSDHLLAALYGTRQALREARRPSVTIAIADASERSLGVLVALFERAVGLYAELIDVNAYDQPGVEAGKQAARANLELLARLVAALTEVPATADALVARVGGDPALVWRLLVHLSQTGRARRLAGRRPHEDRFTSRS